MCMASPVEDTHSKIPLLSLILSGESTNTSLPSCVYLSTPLKPTMRGVLSPVLSSISTPFLLSSSTHCPPIETALCPSSTIVSPASGIPPISAEANSSVIESNTKECLPITIHENICPPYSSLPYPSYIFSFTLDTPCSGIVRQ